jgi:hypothetical protein
MNPAVSLLCPVHFPPFIILAVFLFLSTSALMPLVLGYRTLWRLMYHRGALLGSGQRVRGRVAGPLPPGSLVFGRDGAGALVAEPFCLEAGRARVVVDPGRSLLRGWPRRVKVGDRVTVDGFSDTVTLPGERLYRDNLSEPGLYAVQIARGTLPALRRLTRTITALWLSSLLVLLAIPAFF